jgi:hypothetical protein
MRNEAKNGSSFYTRYDGSPHPLFFKTDHAQIDYFQQFVMTGEAAKSTKTQQRGQL